MGQSVNRSGAPVCSPRLYLWLVLPSQLGRCRLLDLQNGKHTRMLNLPILPPPLDLLLLLVGTCSRAAELVGSATSNCRCWSWSSQKTSPGCWLSRMASIQERRACSYCSICWTSCCCW